jgi:hypothetical protein
MKKKITLMMIIISINSLSISSQTLSNTTWELYETSNTFYLYFHFGTDTLSYSNDDINYTNVSTFQEDGNNFSIIDLFSANACPVSDTGTYNFSIQNDTLKFTPINDPCDSRLEVLSTYHWVRLLTGIKSTNLLLTIEIYPNPVSDVISIKSNNYIQGSTYIIFDQFGRQVLTGKLTSKITSVNVEQLPRGLYFLQIGEKSKQTVKIMKK